jgi:protein Tex
VGDKIQVRVVEVDLARKRIALTARSGAATSRNEPTANRGAEGGHRQPPQHGGRPAGQRPNDPRASQNQRPAPAQKDDGFRNNPFAKLLNKG